jgi:hypothetical protein
MRKRYILLFSLMAVAVLMLSACTGVIAESDQPDANPNASGNVDSAGNTVDTQPDQAAPVDPPTTSGESQPDQGGESNGDQAAANLPTRPELGFPLGKAELVATDPSNVNLASGRIQLIEMFAFW